VIYKNETCFLQRFNLQSYMSDLLSFTELLPLGVFLVLIFYNQTKLGPWKTVTDQVMLNQ